MVNTFLSQIGKPLRYEAEIRAGRPEISIVRKDLDEITMKKDVSEALKKSLSLLEFKSQRQRRYRSLR